MLEKLVVALTQWERHKTTCDGCRAFDASIEADDGKPCPVGIKLFRTILFLLRDEGGIH